MKTRDSVFELFLNYACQAKCAFCYNPPITDELIRRELSFEQAAASLYAAAKSGARSLNLHGGEVTLRDDLAKIVRLARKLGFTQITLVTNGVKLADGRYARSLVAAGVTHARFSVHGPDARSHDAIVEIPGAFERVRRAIGHLRRLKIPIGLNFVLTRANAGLLAPFLRRFVVEDGIEDAIVYFPHERGMMALNAGRIGLTYAEAAAGLRAGLRVLDAAGLRRALLIANLPPCVLPEAEPLLLDWERDPGEAAAAMAHPEGHSTDLLAMKDGQKGSVAACASCVKRGTCRGVESEYVRRYGEKEFRPVPIPAEIGGNA